MKTNAASETGSSHPIFWTDLWAGKPKTRQSPSFALQAGPQRCGQITDLPRTGSPRTR